MIGPELQVSSVHAMKTEIPPFDSVIKDLSNSSR